MKLTILGCGTCSLSTDKACSCYHVAAGSTQILMDCGSGALKRTVEAGLDYMLLDIVLLSHTEHPDHVTDFPMLLFAMNYTFTRTRKKPLIVFGPEGLQDYYHHLLAVHPAASPKNYELEIKECRDDVIQINDLTIISKPMKHGNVPALGFRVNLGDKAIAYSGDTGICDALTALLKGVDIAVVECSVPDGYASLDNHLHAREVGRIAHMAGVKKLLVTHQYPLGSPEEVASQIRESFPGHLEFARDLDIHEP